MTWQRGSIVRRRFSAVSALLGLSMLVATPSVGAADSAARPQVLVDFKDAAAVRLSPRQAQAKRVPLEGGHFIQITTEAAASWPGVLIEPREGKWDLSRFDAVEMDVRNPQDVAVRVAAERQ